MAQSLSRRPYTRQIFDQHVDTHRVDQDIAVVKSLRLRAADHAFKRLLVVCDSAGEREQKEVESPDAGNCAAGDLYVMLQIIADTGKEHDVGQEPGRPEAAVAGQVSLKEQIIGDRDRVKDQTDQDHVVVIVHFQAGSDPLQEGQGDQEGNIKVDKPQMEAGSRAVCAFQVFFHAEHSARILMYTDQLINQRDHEQDDDLPLDPLAEEHGERIGLPWKEEGTGDHKVQRYGKLAENRQKKTDPKQGACRRGLSEQQKALIARVIEYDKKDSGKTHDLQIDPLFGRALYCTFFEAVSGDAPGSLSFTHFLFFFLILPQ